MGTLKNQNNVYRQIWRHTLENFDNRAQFTLCRALKIKICRILEQTEI